MRYEFPHINHIDQVLAAIKDKPEFVVGEKEGFRAINYMVAGEDTFPPVQSEVDALLRECRGIKFDAKTGKLLQRNFQKFFNINEREETLLRNLDFSLPHVVMEKLDGSMVSPLLVDDMLIFTTKAGDTDVAKQAEQFVVGNPMYREFAYDMLAQGMTPIFEFCSRKNRIVIDHPVDRLVLLNIRDNLTGKYRSRHFIENIAELYGIDLVQTFDSISGDALEYVNSIRERKDIEGVVIQFDSGEMLKLKADFYVALHRAKEAISSERRIVGLILGNGLDDLKSIMDKHDFDVVERYEKDFLEQLHGYARGLEYEATTVMKNHTRKEYALGPGKFHEPLMRAFIFKIWDNNAFPYGLVLNKIRDCLASNKSFAAVKQSIFPNLVYGITEIVE